MQTYFDASALVPILIAERGSDECRRQWESTDTAITSAITNVEVHAALAAALRQGRLDDRAHQRATEAFEVLADDMAQVPVTSRVIRSAADLAFRYALRGYDAVHCATALAAASDGLIAASGDRDLLRAWSALGLHTADTAG